MEVICEATKEEEELKALIEKGDVNGFWILAVSSLKYAQHIKKFVEFPNRKTYRENVPEEKS